MISDYGSTVFHELLYKCTEEIQMKIPPIPSLPDLGIKISRRSLRGTTFDIILRENVLMGEVNLILFKMINNTIPFYISNRFV
jgi:hypothetical protein